jgi:hypothetical protein
MFNDQFQQPGRPSTGSSYQREVTNIHVLRFHQAMDLFNRVVAKGRARQLLFFFLRRKGKLIHLNDLDVPLVSSSELGLRIVLINHICGTLGRMNDFDLQFHPLTERLRDRWVSVATAHLEGIGLPAVELIQVRDKYYVQDGHHRISVAKALGQDEIDAKVTFWKTTVDSS